MPYLPYLAFILTQLNPYYMKKLRLLVKQLKIVAVCAWSFHALLCIVILKTFLEATIRLVYN